MLNRKILAALGTALAFTCLVAPVQAKSKHCAKRGYHVTFEHADSVFMERNLHRRGWDDGPYATYACSRKYGRRVFLPRVGTADGGESWIGAPRANARFAAFMTGVGDTGGTERVYSYDLKRGELLYSEPVAVSHDDYSASLSALALSDRGWIGWITIDRWEEPHFNSVHLKDNGDTRVLAEGGTIDPYFLRFDGGSELTWSTATASAPAQ
ncbi:MAG: hypothetical protein ACRDKE_11015 [Solirubrobacterales bacterium]